MVKTQFSTMKEDQSFFLSLVILLIAFGIGSVVRIQFISDIDYPVNDGGLFYSMTEDLIDNGLRLPKFTSYNNEQIPYAYPPLAFYFMAVIKLATKQPLLQLYRIVPMMVNILVVGAFYLFSSKIIRDRVIMSLSVMIFALLPRTYQWFIMGGGITRGLGFLFATLALACIWAMFSDQSKKLDIVGAILFSSACVLSHPETSLFVIFMAGVFLTYHRISWINLKKGLIVAAGVVVCIAPWILAVYMRHGWDPFLVASGTGHGDWLEIKNFLTLNFGFENKLFLPIVTTLALLAVFLKRDRLTYTLSASILLGYYLFPRSGPNLLTLLVSIVAAIGFSEVLLFSGQDGDQRASLVNTLESNLKPKLILTFFVIYLVLGAYSFRYITERDELAMTDDLLNVYAWLEENAGQDDKIMFYPVAGVDRFWWNDFAAEWFPALTTKSNINTVQGSEWVEGQFQERVTEYEELRLCKDLGPDCVAAWEAKNTLKLNYLVIGQIKSRQDFVEHFIQHPSYHVVYQGEDYLVLSRE
jgi:hypothetical protein